MTGPIQFSSSVKVNKRGMIKLPQAVIEINGYKGGTPLQAHYGSNFTCIVLIPVNQRLSNDNATRIKILTTSDLA